MNTDEIDLGKEWQLFQEQSTDVTPFIKQASQKQLDYICSLHAAINTEKSLVDFLYDLKQEFVLTLPLKSDFSLNKLTHNQLTRIIWYLKSDMTLTERQQQRVSHFMKISDQTNQSVKNALRKYTQIDITMLKQKDYQLLCYKIPEFDMVKSITMFTLKRHDTPLKWTPEYEFGYQESDKCTDNKMYYIKFYQFMMMDYDHVPLDYVLTKLDNMKRVLQGSFLFYIYKTYNGFHVFLMSHCFGYYDTDTHDLMMFLGCDQWYIVFCSKNGYKIRLNPKITRLNNAPEKVVAEFVQSYGQGTPLEYCKQMLKIYNDHLNIVKRIQPY